jgi:hypothetical protein
MGFWEFVGSEWQTVKAAPLTFVVVASLAFGGGAVVGGVWRNPEVAAKDTYIHQLEQEKASAAALLDRARQWDLKLTEQQIERLESSLSSAPSKSSVEIITGEEQNAEAAQQLFMTFEKSGWDVSTRQDTTNATAPLILRTNVPSSTDTVERALSGAGIDYKLVGTDGGSKDFWLQYDGGN